MVDSGNGWDSWWETVFMWSSYDSAADLGQFLANYAFYDISMKFDTTLG